MNSDQKSYDVVVVGAGNAAMCAALAAREAGATVAILEWASESEQGGNTAFCGGTMRVAFEGVDDVLKLVDMSESEQQDAVFGSYPASEFFTDVARLTDYRADPDLVDLLVNQSLPTLVWMRSKGVRFSPAYGRQSFNIDGKQKFWGGIAVEVSGGGMGLVEYLTAAASREGISMFYGERAVGLLTTAGGEVQGVRSRGHGTQTEWHASSVVLATGGFQANPEWRARYLGVGWDLARVRGSRFDMGDGLKMALEAGAMPWGNWSGCHAVGWDLNAPLYGDREIGDGFSKHFYPFGIMVNAEGRRFVDEGADTRNFTYAAYGKRILQQPGQFAWQVFDAKVEPLLRPEFYTGRYVSKVKANTLEELGAKMEGVDAKQFVLTTTEYNEAVQVETKFDPSVKDGRRTVGITPPKSNWANTLDEPPYLAFPVTAGITFTFGGLHATTDGAVLDADGAHIPGLFAAGEMVGGLFYGNYPGSTGLTWGAVLGRRAGSAAAIESSERAAK